MRKSLFILAAAALVLAGCEKDKKVDENKAIQKEIAFSTVAQTPKHAPGMNQAPIADAVFPVGLAMKVTAYDATKPGNYFAATTFAKDGTYWKGGKYWPLTPATINFLAIANANADNETGVTWGPSSTNPTQRVQIALGDNKTNQYDLMYACGTGTVTQSTNTLTFPTNVPMEFKHAQAWIHFTVKAGDAASASAITVNKITLNSVSCQGTYTVTHANWDKTAAQRAAADPAGALNGSVSGEWSEYSTYAGSVDAVKAAGYSTLSTSVQDFADLMVVPAQGITTFTINYTFDEKTYDYTYTPASTTLAQATKYTYNITLTLHEIEIAPEVTAWITDLNGNGNADDEISVNIPE